jgi:hypothetical protein
MALAWSRGGAILNSLNALAWTKKRVFSNSSEYFRQRFASVPDTPERAMWL